MMEIDYHTIPSGHPFPKHPDKLTIVRHVDGKPEFKLDLKVGHVQQSMSDHTADMLKTDHKLDPDKVAVEAAVTTYWHDVVKPAVIDAVAMQPVGGHLTEHEYFHPLNHMMVFQAFVKKYADMFTGMTKLQVMVFPWPKAHELALHDGVPNLLVFQSLHGNEWIGSWFCGYQTPEKYGSIHHMNMYKLKKIGCVLPYQKGGFIPGEMVDLASGPSTTGVSLTAKMAGQVFYLDFADDFKPIEPLPGDPDSAVPDLAHFHQKFLNAMGTTVPKKIMGYTEDDLCTGPMEPEPKPVEIGPKMDPLIKAMQFNKKYGKTGNGAAKMMKPSPPVTLEKAQAMAKNFVEVYGGKAFKEIMGDITGDKAGQIAQIMENTHLAAEFHKEFGCEMPKGTMQLYAKLKEAEKALLYYKMKMPGHLDVNPSVYETQAIVHDLKKQIAEAVGKPLMTAQQGHPLMGFKGPEFKPPYIPLHTTKAVYGSNMEGVVKKLNSPEYKTKKTLSRYGVVEVK